MGKRTGALFGVLTAIVFTMLVFDLFGGRIASARVTEAGEGAISTTLLRLRWQAVDMRKHGAHSASGTSIAALGNRILLAEQMGSFFETRMDGDEAEIRRIPLGLETNYAALREYSKELSKGVADAADRDRFVGVTGLRFLADGQTLAASFSHWNDDEKCVTLRVALAQLGREGTDSTSGWRTVFVSDPCIPVREDTKFIGQQAGGGLVEVRPGILYLTVGDFAHDGVENPRSFAQDIATSYGKIFEIDIAEGTHRIVSIGHRNPQGLTVDGRGRVWATEHGPKGGDELNLIEEGKNYGWPNVTLGTNYGSYAWPPAAEQGRHAGYEPPVLAWLPASAPSRLIDVRGFAPEWEGDLLVAFLLGNRLGRIRLQKNRVVYEERIEIGERVRDILQLGDGRILLWTDAARLFLLSPEPVNAAVSRLVDRMPEDLRAVIKDCAQCHDLDAPSGARIGLWGAHGRIFAAGDRKLFSQAMLDRRGVWDDEALHAYLENPAQAVPGTTMQHPGIGDRGMREAVIEFLKQLN